MAASGKGRFQVDIQVRPHTRVRCGASTTSASPATEQGFEEVAEAAATKVLEALSRVGLSAPVRGLVLITGTISAGAQAIIFGPPFGVAQNFIGLVDGLELVLGPGFLADIGVILARQTPIRGLDGLVVGIG